jgi:hypothetical protein
VREQREGKRPASRHRVAELIAEEDPGAPELIEGRDNENLAGEGERPGEPDHERAVGRGPREAPAVDIAPGDEHPELESLEREE